MKVARVPSILRADGWYLDRVRGSHRQFKHLEKPGTVTVPGKPRDELHPKVWSTIRRQARLEDPS